MAIFATGFAGIVAEYLLSTLAIYFLGDSIFQWAMIISLMMFSMGLGSRWSKTFSHQLLRKFLLTEFSLSILVAFAPLAVYTLSAYTNAIGAIIYTFSILIGLLIGMEIPLVIRINDEYEALQFNISSIMENDYYGSLLGGLFFGFIGMPFLGLTYTPFVLGFVNFSVALLLLSVLWKELSKNERRGFKGVTVGITMFLVSGLFFASPLIRYGEQMKYQDKISYAEQTQYQRIVITQWQNDYWLYLNGNQQLCTLDEYLYHEPLVHPALSVHPHPQRVLILGGGDGCAAREVLKYPSVEKITLVDLDPAMTKLAKEHPALKKLNQGSLDHPKVTVINTDGYHYLQNNNKYFDVIIIDLPDPRTVELGRLYSYEFYKTCWHHLTPGGVIVTQAGSPYFATKAFNCITKTMKEAGFTTVPLHNQVITMGEWGWSLGVKAYQGTDLRKELRQLQFSEIPTRWINNEAMQLITSFGKPLITEASDSVIINRIHEPVLYKYYLKGNWDLY